MPKLFYFEPINIGIYFSHYKTACAKCYIMCKMQCKMLHLHIAVLIMRRGSFILGYFWADWHGFCRGGPNTIKYINLYVLPNLLQSPPFASFDSCITLLFSV